jgi:CRISPR-associated protein Cas5t
MLLSLVGEPNRLAHQGSELALALISKPQRSVVLRTLWRVKDAKAGPGLGNNKRPDFQELLSDVKLSVWVRNGQCEKAEGALMSRINIAVQSPALVSRFGGLSLGESTHLVDEIRKWRQGDPDQGQFLIQDNEGDLSLPIWPDHVGSKGTRWGQFRLEESANLKGEPPQMAWVSIIPPRNA